MRRVYNTEMLSLIYETGKRLYHHPQTDIESDCRLAVELGMNEGSFRTCFIMFYKNLVKGEYRFRALTLAIEEYVLHGILREDGISLATKAFKTYTLFTKYKERFSPQPGRRRILKEYEEMIKCSLKKDMH